MIFYESQLERFASPISDTEEEQCKNAIRMIRDALKEIGFSGEGHDITRMFAESFSYQIRMKNSNGYDLKIFVQGSYANGTNIRSESDVDIAVVQENVFRTRYRAGVTDANYRFISVPPAHRSLKDEVEVALVAKFGRKEVKRHNKSIQVIGNSYRKDADSVPSMRYRDYTNDFNNDPQNYIGGVLIKADDGTTIINYPEQHIQNGVKKNKDTAYRFKKMVRIVKNIKILMEEEQLTSARDISSFLIESLLWNVPDEEYKIYSCNRFVLANIINYLYSNISKICLFKEINNIKSIADDGTERINVCQHFINDINRFYEYYINE